MKRCEDAAVAVIGAMLDERGIPWRTHRGGKHLAVIATLPDGEHKFPISGTPRVEAAIPNCSRQHVNAWLDRVGIGSGRGQTAAPSRKRRHKTRTRSTIHRIEVAIDPDTGPARDPWAALAGFRVNR